MWPEVPQYRHPEGTGARPLRIRMEDLVFETELNGHPFIVSGNEQTVQEAAEQARSQQRREYAAYIAKSVLVAPFKAVGTIAVGVGQAVAHNVRESYADFELRSHDKNYGTDLYIRKQRRIAEQHTAAIMRKHNII